LTDVVEKVGGTLTTRSDRIAHDDFLNLSCAFDQYCSQHPSKSFFDSMTHCGHVAPRRSEAAFAATASAFSFNQG
jgi:hypothetical protein